MQLIINIVSEIIKIENLKEIRDIEKILKVLGNKRRLSIIFYLSKVNQAKVGNIANEIGISFKATSKHLLQLFNFDIIEREQNGLEMWYRLSKNVPSNKINNIIKLISNSLE